MGKGKIIKNKNRTEKYLERHEEIFESEPVATSFSFLVYFIGQNAWCPFETSNICSIIISN